MKRSQQKRITQDARIIRHMRQRRSLSLNEAGKLVGISGSAIAHIEQGRMDLSKERLRSLVQAYSFSLQDYLDFIDGRPIPVSYREECLTFLKQVEESKLLAIHTLLKSFAS